MLASNIIQYEVFNIACGGNITLNQVWQNIKDMAPINISPIYRKERKGDVKHSLADVSKARNKLGYDPNVDFNNGLKMTYQWLRNNTI